MSNKNLMQIKKTNDLVRAITRDYGYTLARQESSHMVYTCPHKPSLSIPDNREIARGTLRNLVKLILGEGYYQ